jgi:copper chaperone CopZ
VYFSEDGATTFHKPQLKVAVGVKETTGERPLCYCFGHSVATIKRELQSKGRSDALQDIRKKMKDPGCHCETLNPSGSCCLGAVKKGIATAQSELGPSSSEVPSRSTPASSNRGEHIAKIGTLVSAVVASSCCWLPLLLLAIGVSGAGIASTLEAYRPLFMVTTFGFLGAAYYFTYRPKKNASVGSSDCCATEPTETGDCCAPSAKRRFNMMAINKVMLWGVTLLAVAFLFFPNYVGSLLGGRGDAVTANMNRAVIQVDGMTCEGCASLVADAIRKVPNVLAVEVDYAKGEAIVGTEICCAVPTQAILTALQKAGYSGHVDAVDAPHEDEAASAAEKLSPLLDLSTDAREFREAFNRSKGSVRVVMLVSPG